MYWPFYPWLSVLSCLSFNPNPDFGPDVLALRASLVLTYWPLGWWEQIVAFYPPWNFLQFGMSFDLSWNCWPLVTPGDFGWPRVVVKIGSFYSLSKTAYMALFAWVLVDFKHSGLFSGPSFFQKFPRLILGHTSDLHASLVFCLKDYMKG